MFYEIAGRPIMSFVLDPRQKVFSSLVGAQSLVGKMPASIVLPYSLMPEITRLVTEARASGSATRTLLRKLRAYLDENIQRIRSLSLDYDGDTCHIHLVTADDFEAYDYYLEVVLEPVIASPAASTCGRTRR